MNAWSRGVATAALLAALGHMSLGCATYRDDLDRAVGHYNGRQYDRALALLVVLEPDIDSLSEAERAQYAYYRGMSHFLLDQRLDARHWLGRAAAREKKSEGSLHVTEKKKVDDTLTELNKSRYGGAETPAEIDLCKTDDDCGDGRFCDGTTCKGTKDSKEGQSSDGTEDDPKEGDGAETTEPGNKTGRPGQFKVR